MNSVKKGGAGDGVVRSAAHSRAFRRLSLPAAVLSVALAATQLAAAAPSEADTASTARVAVGHAPVLPKGAAAAAAPAASTTLTLNVALDTGHATELNAYAAGVGNHNSPYYHQYLTPAQIAKYFGASSAAISAVKSELSAEGLTVGSVAPDGMFITATGTVAQAEHAFGVTIAGYKAGGRSFYANTTAPTLPASVSADVSSIVGLDDASYAVPNIKLDPAAKHVVTGGLGSSATSGTGAKANYTVGTCSEMESIFSQSQLYNGTDYYSSDALSSIYGLTPVVNAGNDGAGVTVAVFERENYDPAGVAELDSCYGHSTSVSEIKVDGGPGTAAANMYTGVGVESALDIETIANLAPGVKILDYAAPNTLAGLVANYQAIITQDTAQVISTSWGRCEADRDSSTLQQENTLFQEAAAQGQTVVSASGDTGDTECYGDGTANSSQLEVQDPSNQPYVTAVGGTTMQGLTNPSLTTWDSYSPFTGSWGASGGGVSEDFGAPSYQSGVQAPGYTNCTAGAAGCRQVPDVAALADPSDGFVFDEYYNDDVKGDPVGTSINLVGGTSGAAPVWAAIFALTDATTSCRLNGEAGFANPSLYAAGEGSSAASVFADVTTGGNGSGFGASYSYPAGTGYDMATGWGSPKLAGVMATECQAPIVNPASYFVPATPMRLLNTTPGTNHVGPVTGPVGKYATITLPVANAEGDNVPANATAAVLNVIAVNPTVQGNATVYPDGGRSAVSNINWSAGTTIPNLVVVPMINGKVDLYNYSAGTVNFVVDLEGYFTADSTVANASSYTAVTPVRVVDTRSNHLVGTVVGPLASRSVTTLQIAGQQGLPLTGMDSVVMNVTVTQPTGVSGAASVYAADAPQPNSSNINFVKNETIPNLVIVPLSSTGAIDIYNYSGGTIQYVVDVQGYFTKGTAGDKYHALGPVRLLDTRYGTGQTSVNPIPANKAISLPLPANYDAVIANLTVTGPQTSGALEAYPMGPTMPPVSNVNFGAKETIANLAFVSSNSGVSLYNSSGGTASALLDLAGYFSAN